MNEPIRDPPSFFFFLSKMFDYDDKYQKVVLMLFIALKIVGWCSFWKETFFEFWIFILFILERSS